MQFKSLLFCLAFILGLPLLAVSQSSASLQSSSDVIASDLPVIEGEDWTFYLDAENKVYYIDFETITVNLNDIRVKNETGDIVMKDNLWNLPVNTIYELDFRNLKPGKYEVELRTYTGIIRKDVNIAE